MNFLSQTLEEFYREIGWNESGYYSNLDAVSRGERKSPDADLIHFPIPHSLTVGLGKHISPHLKSGYSLSFQGQNSVAYLSSSQSLESGRAELKPLHTPLVGIDRTSHWNPNTLMYGRLFQDGRLEGLLCRHLSRDWMGVTTFYAPWKGESNLQGQLIYRVPGFVGDISLNTDNQILGFSALGVITKNWAVGTEVYYTAKEHSGGLSVGTRLTKHYKDLMRSVTTLILNPIMGHLATSYSTSLNSVVTLSTRYDFNIYSYDSDVSVGVEFAPAAKNQLLQGRLSLANGLGFCLSGKLEQVLYRIGMETTFGSKPVQNFGLTIELL
ncbi:Mitochondrial distribution and morphology protein 10 [Kappamyces sp. JEL0680]|nr:Mitochondrial distribution and morphology protein 10 [Kappamyces sp. JEL0680]